jgi:hypothetical protein
MIMSSKPVYASRVLLALNGKAIEEKFARDLLRRSSFDIREIDKGVFTLDIAPGNKENQHGIP